MAVKKFVVGCFEDENVLFPAVSKVRKSGYKIHDIYTPYPVHGLDKAMGLRETSLHTAGFMFGLTGTTTAVTFMTWSFTKDWPVNIGGKPNFALPAWIPITFELTVLMASVGMVLTFCYLCQLAPFIKKHHFHARATDDLFVMVIECTAKNNEDEVKNFLAQTGAQQVNTQVAEDGWWIGRYDREQKLYKNDQALA
jgi:Protein of unknown function (DUF3341)